MEQQYIPLKINTPIIYYEHLKLFVRIPENIFNKTNKSYSYVLLESRKNGIIKKAVAMAIHSIYITDNFIDISQDLAITLDVEVLSTIFVKPIHINKICTLIHLECSKPKNQNVQLLTPYLFQKPLMIGMTILHNKEKLKIKYIKYTSKDGLTNSKEDTIAIFIPATEIVFTEPYNERYVQFEQIGGLKEQLSQIRDILELPLLHRDLFQKMNIRAPKGLLLYGPPGTGKTMLAKAIATSLNATFYLINSPAIATKYYGESEQKLRSIFEKASNNAPAIIFIDEIDAITPNRTNSSETDKRIVAQLLVLMDGLNTNSGVMVIAATNLPDALDPAFRRGGRFDIEVEIKLPNEVARKEILDIIFKQTTVKDLNSTKLAEITNGYAGADLMALVSQASLICIKNNVIKNEPLEITMDHIYQAMKRIRPSTMREIGTEKSDITIDSIVGHEFIVEHILNHLKLAQKYKEHFSKYCIAPTSGILLYGAPGTGKTTLAKAIANELNYNLIFLKGPELLNKYVGETQKYIRKIFQKARMGAPCLILIDEIDSLLAVRDELSHVSNTSVIGQFLAEMNNISNYTDVVVIGTTNRPDMLDNALLREGRFDIKLELKRPDKAIIRKLFLKCLDQINLELEPQFIDEITNKLYLHKLTGAHIKGIIREAFILAVKDYDEKLISEIKVNKLYIQRAVEFIINQAIKEYTDTSKLSEVQYN
jgi:transitional endoplasmic reticulum ATPase